MRWLLLWSLLVLGAAVYLTLVWRRFWSQVKAVKADLAVASRRIDEASPGRSNLPSR